MPDPRNTAIRVADSHGQRLVPGAGKVASQAGGQLDRRPVDGRAVLLDQE
jgi:hypothetical protein